MSSTVASEARLRASSLQRRTVMLFGCEVEVDTDSRQGLPSNGGYATRLEAAQAAADDESLLYLRLLRRLAELVVVAGLSVGGGCIAARPLLQDLTSLGLCGPAALSVTTDLSTSVSHGHM